MSTVKKAYVDLVAFLEENKDKKIKSVLPQILVMASAKSGGGGGGATTFHKDDKGNVVAVKCYYHGKWMSPNVVEFGAKASSPTGLNSMCKDGVSKWTKQQRDAKKAKDQLLSDVASGEVEASTLTKALEKIEKTRATIAPFDATDDVDAGYGFETAEECVADNEARGV